MSVYCSKCGSENSDDAKFCFQCGARFVDLNASELISGDVSPRDSGRTSEHSPPGDSSQPAQRDIDRTSDSSSSASDFDRQPERPQYRESPLQDPNQPTPQAAAPPPKLEFASFGARLVAFFLDLIMLTLLAQIALKATRIDLSYMDDFGGFWADYMNSVMSGQLEGAFAAYFESMMLQYFIISVVILAYYVIFHAFCGQTIGKLALGIRVTRKDGSPIGVGRSLLRYVVYWIGSKPMYLGVYWALFNKEVATWHDFAADTRVYKVASLEALDAYKTNGASQ